MKKTLLVMLAALAVLTVWAAASGTVPVPGWDALLYLEGMFSKEQIRAFRTFSGPNAYPTHVDPGIQIPTGSLGLGPGAAAALALSVSALA